MIRKKYGIEAFLVLSAALALRRAFGYMSGPGIEARFHSDLLSTLQACRTIEWFCESMPVLLIEVLSQVGFIVVGPATRHRGYLSESQRALKSGQ